MVTVEPGGAVLRLTGLWLAPARHYFQSPTGQTIITKLPKGWAYPTSVPLRNAMMSSPFVRKAALHPFSLPATDSNPHPHPHPIRPPAHTSRRSDEVFIWVTSIHCRFRLPTCWGSITTQQSLTRRATSGLLGEKTLVLKIC